MATIARLDVLLGLNDKNFTKGLEKSRRSLNSWGDSLRKTGTQLTAFASVPIGAFFVKAFQGAASLEQAMGKVETVFDSNSKSVISWSEDSADAFGLTQTQALSTVGTLGMMFKSMGKNEVQSAKMSQNVVALAADWSAFSDIPVPQVLDMINAGLIGEYDGLQRLIPSISAAAVQQKAMEMGFGSTAQELTQSEKALAAYQLILEESAPIVGTFAAESEGAAGSLAIFQAHLGEATAMLGKTFLPIATSGLQMLTGWIKAFKNLDPQMQKWIVGIAAVVAVMGPLLIMLGLMLPALALLLSPIGLLITAAALLAFVFRGPLISGAKDLIDQFIDLREMGFSPLASVIAMIGGRFESLIPLMGSVWDGVQRLTRAWGEDGLSGVLRALPGVIGSIAGELARLLASMVVDFTGWVIRTGVPAITGWVADHAGDVWGGIKAAAGWLWTGLVSLGTITLAIAGWIVTSVVDLGSAVYDWITNTALPAVDKSARSLGTFLVNIAGWLVTTTVDLADKVDSWFRDTALPTVDKAARDLGTFIVDVAGWLVTQTGDLAAELKSKMIGWIGGLQLTSTDVITVGTKLIGAITDAVGLAAQSYADIAAKLFTWLRNAIEGVDWNAAGSTFAKLLVAGIKGVVLLAGLAGYLLGQILLALVDVDWGAVATSFGQLMVAAIKALGAFLTGFGTTLYNEIVAELGNVDWVGIGTILKDGFVSAVTGIGSAIASSIASELPGWLKNILGISGSNGDIKGTAANPGDVEYPGTGTGFMTEGFLGAGAGAGGMRGLGAKGGGLAAIGAQIAAQLQTITTAIATETAKWPPPVLTSATSMRTQLLTAVTAMQAGLTTSLGAMLASTTLNFTGMRTAGTTNALALQTGVLASAAATVAGWASNLGSMAATTTSRFASIRSTGTSEANSLQSSVLASAASTVAGWASRLANMASTNASRFADIRATGTSETSRLESNALASIRDTAAGWGSRLADMAGTTGRQFGTIRSTGTSETDSLQANVARHLGTMASQSAIKIAGMQAGLRLKFLAMKSNSVTTTDQLGTAIVNRLATAGGNAVSRFGGQIGRLAGIVSSRGGGAIGAARSLGINIGGALADGLWAMGAEVGRAAANLVAQADAAIRLRAEIRSPSRVFMQLGELIGEGLAVGMEAKRQRLANVARDITRMLASITQAGVTDLTSSLDTVLNQPAGGTYTGRIIPVATIDNSRMGGPPVINNHNYYSVTPDDLRNLIDNANAGGEFARGFGGELANRGGKL